MKVPQLKVEVPRRWPEPRRQLPQPPASSPRFKPLTHLTVDEVTFRSRRMTRQASPWASIRPELHAAAMTAIAAACGLHRALLRLRLGSRLDSMDGGRRGLQFGRWHVSWGGRTEEKSAREGLASKRKEERRNWFDTCGCCTIKRLFWNFLGFPKYPPLNFFLKIGM